MHAHTEATAHKHTVYKTSTQLKMGRKQKTLNGWRTKAAWNRKHGWPVPVLRISMSRTSVKTRAGEDDWIHQRNQIDRVDAYAKKKKKTVNQTSTNCVVQLTAFHSWNIWKRLRSHLFFSLAEYTAVIKFKKKQPTFNFSTFRWCLRVALSLEKGTYSEILHFVTWNKHSFEAFMCLDLTEFWWSVSLSFSLLQSKGWLSAWYQSLLG